MRVGHYSGTGNTFFLVDNRQGLASAETILFLLKYQLPRVDGVLILCPGCSAPVSLQIYNRDGSEAEMCGNGLRCCIDFLQQLGVHEQIYSIETRAGIQKGWFSEGEVCVALAPPKDLRLYVTPEIHFINTGVPHALIFVDHLDQINVNTRGKELRFSPLFFPDGANVNFVALNADRSLSVRTFERGVEAETLACGTGVTAAALIAHQLHGLPSPVTIWVKSGKALKITFTPDFSSVILQGEVTFLNDLHIEFEGELSTIKKPSCIMARHE